MNYLAHTFLSFSDGQIVGNLLEDYVSNSARLDYPAEVAKGVIMHRAIDTFTDIHPAILEVKKVFSPIVRLYSGAFVDVTMDYFLANDPEIKSKEEWREHSKHVYKVLRDHWDWLPVSLQEALPRMEASDWLYNYREDFGMKSSLEHLVRKAKYLEPGIPVYEVFLKNKEALQQCYDVFFPELLDYCRTINDSLKIPDINTDPDS